MSLSYNEIIMSAENGDLFAQLRLADFFFNIEKEPDIGVYFLILSALQGYDESVKKLSDFYEAKRDFRLAIDFCKKAIGIDKSEEILKKFEEVKLISLEKAASKGYSYASYYLGKHYLKIEEYSSAVYHFERAMDLHQKYAFYEYGKMYLNGVGVKKDVNKAYHYIEKSLELGLDESKIDLGKMILSRETVFYDEKLAFDYLNEAYKEGFEFDPFLIARLYIESDVVDTDIKRAKELLEVSYKMGNANALYRLGLIANKEQDKLFYFSEAAKLKDIDGLLEMAKRLEKKEPNTVKLYLNYILFNDCCNESQLCNAYFLFSKISFIEENYLNAYRYGLHTVELATDEKIKKEAKKIIIKSHKLI